MFSCKILVPGGRNDKYELPKKVAWNSELSAVRTSCSTREGLCLQSCMYDFAQYRKNVGRRGNGDDEENFECDLLPQTEDSSDGKVVRNHIT